MEKKKLLILGGANVHVKVVNAAHEMGIETVVIDYLDVNSSPAKQLSDAYYDIDINDIDRIVALCKKERIDGVISLFLDPAQIPYYKICNILGLPCYISTWEQVFALTNKEEFKRTCISNGLDVIPTYDEECPNDICYPVLVKPVHSRGSRGQSVCYNFAELLDSLKIAKKESDNNQAIIEKYMNLANDFTMTYYFENGIPYLVRTADRILGKQENGLDKVAMAEVTPSKFHKLYIEKYDLKVKQMLTNMGIINGPVFMQGFIDNGTLRLYDPGFRFPGTEFDLLFIKNLNVNLIKKMIHFALYGKTTSDYGQVSDEMSSFNGKIGMELWPCVKPGVIDKVLGFNLLDNMQPVVCYTFRHKTGDLIGDFRNVNQRLAEIDLLCESINELKKTVNIIHNTISCLDTKGQEMIFNKLDVHLID